MSALVMVLAVGVAAGAAMLGDGAPLFVVGAMGYVAAAWITLALPAALALQVGTGVALAAGLLVSTGGPPVAWVAAIVAGVVVTAEVSGSAARLRGPVARPSGPELARAGAHGLIGAASFVLVAWIASLPGPGGATAVALASGACAALAALLVRSVPLPGTRRGSIVADERRQP